LKTVFVDGRAGTTGLRIYERLAERADIKLLWLSDEERKDIAARKEMLNTADIAVLCLPDAAAREAVPLIENPEVTVLDTSTAHRTKEGWTYGFPELSDEHGKRIVDSKRIAVPGCHATGFIALVYPLIEASVISEDTLLACHSLTGYSGGGKSMITQYEEDPDVLLQAPREYALGQTHKHLAEMKAMTGLAYEPVFCPIVSDFYSGMLVTVSLFSQQLDAGKTIDDVRRVLQEKYNGPVVRYCESMDDNGYISAAKLEGKDSMQIAVYGNGQRMLLMALYDNLGKGSAGAAIECINLKLGIDRATGLDL
jgi:N-acetyl-gamma-glutamyl-phosphate reductase